MKRLKLFVIALTCVLPPLCTAASQVYEPTWRSLDTRPTPQWFSDAKFGIFIHWGVYSVPAWAPTEGVGVYGGYAEWYWMGIKGKREAADQFQAFHNRVYGRDFQYQDFAPMFKAEMFDPDHWADVFARSGAKYVVLTSKHHDGFCLWPSKQSWNWNSLDVGPHLDLAGMLTSAVRARGLNIGFYYSLYEWYNPLYSTNVDRYVDEHMLPQLKDLVLRYRPDILWADGEWDRPSKIWRSEEFLAWLYNDSPVRDNVVVNDRWGKETRGRHGGYYTTEYSLVHNGTVDRYEKAWEECRGIGHSFGYNRNETLDNYSTAEQLIHLLVNIVSKGGNLLLDIGPTADGRIPVIMEQRLVEIGDWLKVNGQAIYATKRWAKIAEDNKKVCYTCKGDAVYAISLDWPGKELVLSVSGPSPDTVVKMLGRDGNLKWRYDNGKMYIDTSSVTVEQMPCSYAYAFKITGDIKP